MGDRGLAIFAGIAEGIERASQNIYNINLMKYKLGQEKEAFTLDKKVKEAQLKQLEFEHGPEAVAHLRKKMDLESKQFKVANEIYDLTLGEATKENQAKLNEMKTRFETLGITQIGDIKLGGNEATFRSDLRIVQEGKADWNALEEKYPDKVDTITKIKQQTEDKEVLAKTPIQHVGIADPRRAQPGFANMNPATRAITQQIKTKGDLRKLINKASSLQTAGVNVQALMDYYKDEIAGM